MSGRTLTMKAIRIAAGPPPRLEQAELRVPGTAPGQVLIKVAAAGLNRADLLQAEGRYPPPKGAPETLGLEVSGTIVAAGDGVRAYGKGDPVCALLQGGGYAEFAAASELCVLPAPEGVALRDAAALPEAYFTVWANLFDGARMRPGETLLVHGGTSGIGTAAIQLMRARGHPVFATAGSPEKCKACIELGAVRAIDYRSEDFVAAMKEETGGRGVDVILDIVGGDYVERNLAALARGGRLVNIAYQKGSRVELDLQIMLARSLTMTASALRPRSNEEKGSIRDALLREVWPLFAQGRIRPVIDMVFPLAEAGKAHAHMRAGSHIGKILLIP
ncbi:MAG: NAD(P)H-quinone oxidoreductase [Alphaproteobacteria bacterium]